MKLYLKILSTIFVSLFFSSAAMAQLADADNEKGDMRGHHMMMPGMYPHQGTWELHGQQGHHGRRFGNAAAHLLHMKERLGLNQGQIDELKKLRDAYRVENTVNEAKLKVDKEELREFLQEDSINTEKAEAKIKEIGTLEVSIRTSSVKQLAKIKTIIPKEQMKKLHRGRKHDNDD
ncbi:MAG: Spy/CpxP family protein refolding chaperone [Nitrospiria bacterium]